MARFKHILFDLDGTLSDPSRGIINSLKSTLKTLEQPFDEKADFSWVIGPTLHYAFSKILSTDNREDLDKAVEIFRDFYREGGLYENELFHGVTNTLQSLKNSNLSLYVATSKPQWFAEPILQKFEIDTFFDEICGSLKDSRREKSEIIEHIIQNNNLDPNTCLMVGDRKFDILSAKELGLSSVGVTFGFAEDGELEAANPDHIVNCFDEILDFALGNFY